jgi:ATP synthase protein I
MWTAVSLQAGALIAGSLIALLFWGMQAGWFFALGGLAALIPNALFALRLSSHKGRSAESYPVVFFLGEFTKIALTLAALGGLIKIYGDKIEWLALLLGLILVLKAPLAMWWLEVSKDRRTNKKFIQDTY